MKSLLLLAALAGALGAQAKSTTSIPVKKVKAPPHADTVKIWLTRVDTVVRWATVVRTDTLMRVRVDTLKDSTCAMTAYPFPVPVPVPIHRGANGLVVTPEPGTLWLTVAGGAALGLVYLAFIKK